MPQLRSAIRHGLTRGFDRGVCGAGRLAKITVVALNVYGVWRSQEARPAEQRTRGAVLRAALTELGPVFVKCGQTLSERPDVVRAELTLCACSNPRVRV